jgi:hypothetical protein
MGAIDAIAEWSEIAAEQRTEDDGAREAHHLFGDIDGLPALRHGLPLCSGLTRGRCHLDRQFRDALAVEGRLRDAALPQPEFVLTGQQPVAEKHPQLW